MRHASVRFPRRKFNKRYLVTVCGVCDGGGSTVSRYLAPPRQEYKPSLSRVERAETHTLTHPLPFSLLIRRVNPTTYTHKRTHTCRRDMQAFSQIRFPHIHDLPSLRFSSFIEQVTPPFPCKL